MIPLLYDIDEQAFGYGCICRLPEAVRCVVTEARNGSYECEFVYPLNGENYKEITIGRHLGCTHDANGDLQPFTIYRREENTDGTVTFYAHHITYELNQAVAQPFTVNGVAAIMERFSGNSGVNHWNGTRHPNWYEFSTDLTSTTTFTLKTPVAFRSFLGGMQGSVLDAFGGEYEWDKYHVTLHKARGADNGAVIRYGGNLVNAENTDDNSGCYGGVKPFWKSSDGNTVVVYSVYIKDDSDEKYYPYRVMPLDVSTNFQEQPTQQQVDAYAQSYINNNQTWVPYNNITVDFVPWTDEQIMAESTQLQNVCLCDIVTVDIPQLDMKVSTKVVKTVWNVLLDRYDSIELGKTRTSLAEMITSGVGTNTTAGGSGGGGAGISDIVMNADYTLTISLSNGTSYTVGPIRGEPGAGLAAGGTQGQILVKHSDADYDTEWSSTLPAWLLNTLYPVGSVYITMGNTNPHNFLGGTWQRFGIGRTLIGVGEGTDADGVTMQFSEGASGGYYKHTLTIDEMPSHNHTYYREVTSGQTSTGVASARAGNVPRNQFNVGNTGGGEAFRIIQPYTTVYFWKRTE